jgi:hypothetical protein
MPKLNDIVDDNAIVIIYQEFTQAHTNINNLTDI